MPLKPAESRKYQRRRYREMKAQGRCKCGRPSSATSVRCDRCKAAHKVNCHKNHARVFPSLKNLGLCVRCKTRESVPGRVTCGACAELSTDYQRTYYHNLKKRGKCPVCRGVPSPGKVLCQDCLDKKAARRKRPG